MTRPETLPPTPTNNAGTVTSSPRIHRTYPATDKMLDVIDFIKERGGDPEKIRESQRRRHAPVEVVDEVIAMWEDHRKTNYAAMQMNTKINEVQKAIGQKKKVGGSLQSSPHQGLRLTLPRPRKTPTRSSSRRLRSRRKRRSWSNPPPPKTPRSKPRSRPSATTSTTRCPVPTPKTTTRFSAHGLRPSPRRGRTSSPTTRSS